MDVEFLPEPLKTLTKSNSPKPLLLNRSLSDTTIDIDHHHGEFKIDGEALKDLVKNKNQEKLQSLGGLNGLVSALNTNTCHGINDEADEIQLRRSKFGSNTYTLKKSLVYFVVEALKSLTILIHFGCAMLSLAFGIKEHGLKEGWYDGGSIFVAVFLVVAVSAGTNFRKKIQFDKDSKESNDKMIDVVRNGGPGQKISIFDIVVGDIICLNKGDQVPADGVLVEGHSQHVDNEAMMDTFLSSGTKVTGGSGKMMVTSVGLNTDWGKEMSKEFSPETYEKTPFKSRLNKLASRISKVALLVAFLVMFVPYFTGSNKDKKMAAAVAIIVVEIPEGSPLAVTLAWAYSVKRMMKYQAILRKLYPYETMGSVTAICTDKTGTLKVTDFWFGLESGKAPSSLPQKVVALFHQGIAINTTGRVFKANSGSEYEFSGSPTEKAILSWAVDELKMDTEEVMGGHDVVHVEAFNSEKRRSGVLVKKKGETLEKNVVHHWKGAAKKILEMCCTFYDASGGVKEIDEDVKIQIEQIIKSMEAKSLHCIAFACSEDGMQEKLSLLGIVGVKQPVEDFQYAGVNIKMITGDDVSTARANALECGILTPDDEMNREAVLEAEEFRNYSEQERLEKVERIKVMARATPVDQLLLAKCLREKGHVVAVTSDAPADIRLLLGTQGTELTKESSHIVILDDNFASVAPVMKWGRCLYNNIQKFIQFQLTIIITALVINLVAAASGGEVALTTVQSLWATLIMDTVGALALVTEKPTNHLMKKKPIGRNEAVISNVMWRNVLAQALYQISVLLLLQFRGRSFFDVTKKVKNILIFNTFVLCQVFNVFNSRSLEKKNVFRGILKNRLFVGIIVVMVVLQVAMLEFLKRFTGTETLNWGQWGVSIAIAAASWPIGWLVKSLPVPETHFFSYLNWNNRSS